MCFNWFRIIWFVFNIGIVYRENINFLEKYLNFLLCFFYFEIIILFYFFVGYINVFENVFSGISLEIGKFVFVFYNGLFLYNGW